MKDVAGARRTLCWVSDGVLVHCGFQTVPPHPGWVLLPEPKPRKGISYFFSRNWRFSLFTCVGNTRIFFFPLVVDPGSHLVASLLGFFLFFSLEVQGGGCCFALDPVGKR